MNHSLLKRKQETSNDGDSAQKANDFQTPAYAIKPLLSLIKKNHVIWECSVGEGNLTNAFTDNGYVVFSSDIKKNKFGPAVDFLDNSTVDARVFTCIVTNPPYLPRGIKDKFLEQCYWWYENYNKPFALLMPLSALEGKKRQAMYKRYGLHLILMNKRINYITPNKREGTTSWFASAWFTCGFTNSYGVEREITYYEF